MWVGGGGGGGGRGGGRFRLNVYQTSILCKKPRETATPRDLTPDVWAQIGGKWVLFGPRGRGGDGVPLYGCICRGFTPVWVCFYRVNTLIGVFSEDLHPYEPLEMRSYEHLEASSLTSLTYGI